MKYISFVFSFICFMSVNVMFSQTNMDSLYQANLSKKKINGVYIPVDMKEAFRELIHLSSEKSLDKLKAAPEEIAATKLHLGLGKWISAKWNFYEGSRFTQYLNDLGVTHPDDMIQFTIVSFHRFLNQRDLALQQRADAYKLKRENEFAERLKKARTIEKRKRVQE